MRSALLLTMIAITASAPADVLRLTDGTSYTGLLLQQTSTETLFERRQLMKVPKNEVTFIDETGTTGSDCLLIPKPQKIIYGQHHFPISWVRVNSLWKSEEPKRQNEFLRHALESRGISIKSEGDFTPEISLCLGSDKSLHSPDEYSLNVDSQHIKVSGNTASGVWNAVQTLLQLITGDREHGFEIRQCSIEDWPSTPRRICHLPRLTHKSDLELFRRYARLLARYKFNTLILENSGAIKLDKYPEAWWSDGFSKDEIRSLISDFKDLGFEVIPQLNSFGHVDEWLGAEPSEIEKYHLADLFSTAEYHDTLNPCNRHVYDILFDCYNEMLDVYGQPKYFHVGLDEARRRGFGKSAECKGEPPSQIFADHANRIGEFFATKNITPIMWADLLLNPAQFPGIDNCNGGPTTNFSKTLDLIAQPYVLMDWHYDAPDPSPTLKYLAGTRHEVWATPWKDARNTYGHARAAKTLGLKAICATTWNFFDRGTDYMREIDILSAPILVAQYAWNPDAPPPGSPDAWNESDVFLRTWPFTAEKW